MHTEDEAFDDAKRDEAPQVDVRQRAAVFRVPFSDAEAVTERGEELHDADSVDFLATGCERPDIFVVIVVVKGEPVVDQDVAISVC